MEFARGTCRKFPGPEGVGTFWTVPSLVLLSFVAEVRAIYGHDETELDMVNAAQAMEQVAGGGRGCIITQVACRLCADMITHPSHNAFHVGESPECRNVMKSCETACLLSRLWLHDAVVPHGQVFIPLS